MNPNRKLARRKTIKEDLLKSKIKKQNEIYIYLFFSTAFLEIFFCLTSEANDNLLISPPEIPLVLPKQPITVFLHFSKPN